MHLNVVKFMQDSSVKLKENKKKKKCTKEGRQEIKTRIAATKAKKERRSREEKKPGVRGKNADLPRRRPTSLLRTHICRSGVPIT